MGETTMDLEERLKLLKKERAARRRPDPVAQTWKSIDTERGLSTKEKLERLIRLTNAGDKPKPRREVEPRDRRATFRVIENHYHLETRYGKSPLTAGLKITGKVLSDLGPDKSLLDKDLNSALFIDLETMGPLSIGAGTVPFLIGAAYYRDEKFHIVQFFLEEPAAEPAMIHDFAAFLDGLNFRWVISYNGKAFDLPLLENRFTLNRMALPLSGLPHLDFLFPARRLWKHKQESCQLCQLARDILGAGRDEDIPSAEIPLRYTEYLRTRNFSLIEPVLYHNQEDLLSLLGVIIAGAGLFSEDADAGTGDPADGMDWFGAARVLEKAGETERSVACLQRALSGRLSGTVEIEAKKKLAAHFKRSEDWEKAAELWQQMAPLQQLFCFRELAMYHEHRRKDYEKARDIAEEGLALAAGVSRAYEADFAHRLERLRARLKAHTTDRRNKD